MKPTKQILNDLATHVDALRVRLDALEAVSTSDGIALKQLTADRVRLETAIHDALLALNVVSAIQESSTPKPVDNAIRILTTSLIPPKEKRL